MPAINESAPPEFEINDPLAQAELFARALAQAGLLLKTRQVYCSVDLNLKTPT